MKAKAKPPAKVGGTLAEARRKLEGVGSRFIDGRMTFQRLNGRVYMIDAALIPALNHVPRELLPLLLKTLDRDLRARHKQWMRSVDRAAHKRSEWMEEAIRRYLRGDSFASIGLALNARNPKYGSADRIARTVSAVVGHRKK